MDPIEIHQTLGIFVASMKLRLRGDKAHEQGLSETAVSLYEAAFGLNAGDSESLFKAGALLLSEGRSSTMLLDPKSRSLQYLARSVEHNGLHLARLNFLAFALRSDFGMFYSAVDTYKKILAVQDDWISSEGLSPKCELVKLYRTLWNWEANEVATTQLTSATPCKPLGALSWGLPAHITHRMAQAYSSANLKRIPELVAESIADRGETLLDAHTNRSSALKVGCYSSEFRNHPLMRAFGGAISSHNATVVKASCFSTQAHQDDYYYQFVFGGCDSFEELQDFGAAVSTTLMDDVDVIINMDGTSGVSTPLPHIHPAPLSISAFGYMSTLGAKDTHFIISDTILTPVESAQRAFTEKLLLFGKGSVMMPLDMGLGISRENISAELESARQWVPLLPTSGLLLVAIHKSPKVGPADFSTWMNALQRFPQATLLLSQVPNHPTSDTLVDRAHMFGVSSHRIIPLPSVPNHLDHMQRLKALARTQRAIFLDVEEYGAHSTAIDVVQSGTAHLLHAKPFCK
jgi:predicted O-linked N-acetylglucosamine transferase (SPINDLY family)